MDNHQFIVDFPLKAPLCSICSGYSIAMFDYWRAYFILFHTISSFSKVAGYLLKPEKNRLWHPHLLIFPAAEGTPKSPPCPRLRWRDTPWTSGSRRKDVLGIQVFQVDTIWLWHSQFAMECPNHKWRYLDGKIIYFYGPFKKMAMLNNQSH